MSKHHFAIAKILRLLGIFENRRERGLAGSTRSPHYLLVALAVMGLLLLPAPWANAQQSHAPKYFFANADYGQYPYTDLANQFSSAEAGFVDGWDRSGPGHWWVYTQANCSQPSPAGYYDVYLSNKIIDSAGYYHGDLWQATINRYLCGGALTYNGPADPLELQWAECNDTMQGYYPGSDCQPPVLNLDKRPGPQQCPNCTRGDPIDAGTGNIYSVKTEFRGSGQFPLEFTWTYNSLGLSSGFYASDLVLGSNRSHSYQRSVHVSVLPPDSTNNVPGITSAYLARPDGKTFVANFNGASWSLDADIVGILTSRQDANGNFLSFSYLNDRNETESYDASGNLLSITDKNGFVQTVSRDSAGRILSVQDPFGRSLRFLYDTSGRIQQLTQPDGGTIAFTYDTNNNLQTVTYPDQKIVQYNYNESAHTSGASLPNALTSVIDENAQTYTTYSYDTNGNGIGNYHGTGAAAYTISYANGVSITTPSGSVETPLFQPSVGVNHLLQITETCAGCNAVTTQYTYASNGHVQTKTDPNGYVSAYQYNAALPLVTQLTEAQGQTAQRITQTDWNTALIAPTEKRVLESDNSLVNKTDFVYNTRGQVLARCVIDHADTSGYVCSNTTAPPAGAKVRRWTYNYCNSLSASCPVIGLLLSVDGPRTDVTDVTSYAYYQSTDSCVSAGTCRPGDIKTVTNALGQVTTYVSYDKNGRVTRMQDANGTYTDMTYHPRGWLLTRTVRANADGSVNASLDATMTLGYDNVGNVTKVTDPDGAYLSYTYDAAHRLYKITDKLGATINYTLDAAGNHTLETRVNGAGSYIMNYVYDQLNRLTKMVDNGGTAEQTYTNPPEGGNYTDGYDGNGNRIYSVDGNGVGTEQQYDPLNRLIKTLQDHATGSPAATHDTTTQYAYDTRDNLRSVTDPDNLVTSYTYDGLNNLTGLTSPDTGNASYTYDAAGNRQTQTDARGVVSTYNYDALNRLVGISYPTTSLNITYAYDVPASGCYNVGRLTKITDSSGSTTYCYDRRGNVLGKTQVTSGLTLANSYTYTLADRLLTLTYPGGAIVTYGRDASGRINNVKYQASAGASATTLVSNATYYAFGPMNVLTFGNGRTLTKGYYSNYVVSYVHSSAANGLQLNLTPDALGNIKDASTSPGLNPPTAAYKYDNLYRLTELDHAGAVAETYAYDRTGDRTSLTASGTTSTYTYTPGTHRLASVGGVGRSYDPNGNLLTNANGTLSYDDRNRMVALNPGSPPTGTPESRYDYNGKGEQVLYQTGTAGQTLGSQYRPYDEGGHLLGQYTNTGYARQQFIYMDGQLVAETAYGTLYYVETDQLGTPRVIADTSNNNAWTWDYFASAFGTNPPVATVFTHDLRFPGQVYDAQTRLNYNYFRDYEPGTGRYVESDPIGLYGGISAYSYANGSPLVKLDRYGLSSECTECDSQNAGSNSGAGSSDDGGGGPDPEPGLEGVYPELFIIPLARAGSLAGAARSGGAALIKKCKNIRCKLPEIHDDHHTFGWPFNSKMCHLQLNCWIKGIKGSQFTIRIPYPCDGGGIPGFKDQR